MRIYWYRPWQLLEPRLERSVLRPGDHLTVETLAPGGRPEVVSEDVDGASRQWRRVLPDVAPPGQRGLAWAAGRGAVYLTRARRRHATVAAGRFDLLHVSHPNYFTDAVALPLLARHAPLVCEVHDVLPHWRRRLPPRVERSLVRQVYRRPDVVVVLHRHLSDRLVADFGVSPGRIRVIPLEGVPLATAREHPPPDDPPTVLFYGTFRHDKGIPVLLDAIRRTTVEARFVLAGRGRPELQTLVREAAAADPRVTAHVGARLPGAEVNRLLTEAAVLVLPYVRSVAQSGVLRDAWRAARPVVVTDVGAMGPTVREHGAGWVVPPGDPATLARALEDAVADRSAREAAGRAMARVPDFITVEEHGARLREVWDEVAAAGG